MKCRQYSELLTAFIDQEIGPSDLVRLHLHLRECPSCRRRIESMRSAQELFRGHLLRPVPLAPSPGFARTVAARVTASGGTMEKPERVRRGFRMVAACASLAAAAVVVLFLWFQGRGQSTRLLPVYEIRAQQAQVSNLGENALSEYVDEHELIASQNPMSMGPGFLVQVSTQE